MSDRGKIVTSLVFSSVLNFICLFLISSESFFKINHKYRYTQTSGYYTNTYYASLTEKRPFLYALILVMIIVAILLAIVIMALSSKRIIGPCTALIPVTFFQALLGFLVFFLQFSVHDGGSNDSSSCDAAGVVFLLFSLSAHIIALVAAFMGRAYIPAGYYKRSPHKPTTNYSSSTYQNNTYSSNNKPVTSTSSSFTGFVKENGITKITFPPEFRLRGQYEVSLYQDYLLVDDRDATMHTTYKIPYADMTGNDVTVGATDVFYTISANDIAYHFDSSADVTRHTKSVIIHIKRVKTDSLDSEKVIRDLDKKIKGKKTAIENASSVEIEDAPVDDLYADANNGSDPEPIDLYSDASNSKAKSKGLSLNKGNEKPSNLSLSKGGEEKAKASSLSLTKGKEDKKVLLRKEDEPTPAPKQKAASKSKAEEIRELKALLDDGIITEEEFQKGKETILNK